MNLNFYHYVTVIAESGSLSTASERLFITQSALTQALKKMEQTFGGPLFLYQNRSMQITPLGQIVLETARAIEDAKLEMTNAIARPETAAKHLSVAVNVQTGALLMGKVFAQFHHRYPDLMVHFLTTTTNSAKRLLECYPAFYLVLNHATFKQIKKRHNINYSDGFYIGLLYAVPLVLS